MCGKSRQAGMAQIRGNREWQVNEGIGRIRVAGFLPPPLPSSPSFSFIRSGALDVAQRQARGVRVKKCAACAAGTVQRGGHDGAIARAATKEGAIRRGICAVIRQQARRQPVRSNTHGCERL